MGTCMEKLCKMERIGGRKWQEIDRILREEGEERMREVEKQRNRSGKRGKRRDERRVKRE